MSDKQPVIKENKMGVMPINKLLISMSLPMIISMLVQALYNVVDSIFVAMINEEALTAVSLVFPIQNLMIAVASGTGVGVNALLSRYLGQKKPKEASQIALQGLFITGVAYLIFLTFGLLGSNLFMSSQTDDPMILQYGNTYLRICCILSFGLFLQITLERLLQATGRTFYTMITQGTGAIINIVMDPILIFGIGPFPEMGVAGAAAATIFGQLCAATLALIFNIKKNHDIHVSFAHFRPNKTYISNILKIGVPSIIMMSIGSVMTFCLNKILIGFTATAVAVFGVYFKLQSFIFMPVMGLNNGMVPIVAYNYGARQEARVHKTHRVALAYSISIMCLGLLLFQLIPEQLLGFFSASENMVEIGVPALRIISIHFPIAGFCIITMSVCQALGYSMYSMFNSMARQLIILIPAALLLAQLGNVNLVWWAFPIAEVFSLFMAIFFIKKVYKKIHTEM